LSEDGDEHTAAKIVMSPSAPLFRFAVIADSHLNPEGTPNTSPWRTNRLANDRTKFVVNELNRLQPAFVVHLGDIIHPLPAHPAYKPAADTAKRIFGQLTRPLYLLAGNHDIGDKPLDWMPADCITEDSVRLFRETFGDDWGAFDHGDCRFVKINSSLLNSDLSFEYEQKRWLEAELGEAAGRRIFLFTHYPPYVSCANESSHYDNLDEPGRSWLCNLLVRHRIEALFAGHVHNFFYNRHGATDCYVLPSVTSLRQDYAEFFRVEPADEYGRNDTAKLGFLLIDVHHDRHVARFVRTHGATVAKASFQLKSKTTERPVLSPIGVHLRHPWAEETELPHNAPLDELSRKRARNDYQLLAMWDLGIVKLRVPLSDLTDDRIRRRMIDLHELGQRFTVFTFGLPDEAVLHVMAANRTIVARWEMVLPLWALETARARLLEERELSLPPVWFSRLRGHTDANQDASKPFDHSISLGFDVSECEEQLALLRGHDHERGVPDGLVFKIGINQRLEPNVMRISELSESLNFRATICATLAPTRSAAPPQTDHAIANRVAEVVLCAWCTPKVEMFLDTFQDIDRGYFLRPGLIDRRCNPRLAGHVFRDLQLALQDLQPQGPLQETAREAGRAISFQARDASGVLWLPGIAQSAGTRLGNAAPLVLPESPNGDICGPWIEITRSQQV
jgi:hypothetical protein